jgi:hypothetical protein
MVHEHARPVWRQGPTARRTPAPLPAFRERSRPAHASPVWPPGPTRSRSPPHVPRRHPDPHVGEALFVAGTTRGACIRPGTFRERSRLLHGDQPVLAARTHNARTHNLCIGSSRFENDPRPTHGRSPVWRADPRRSYERSLPRRTPRGRPSGMELPDYPVMASVPHRRTRMGPHLRFPPGLFPYS